MSILNVEKVITTSVSPAFTLPVTTTESVTDLGRIITGTSRQIAITVPKLYDSAYIEGTLISNISLSGANLTINCVSFSSGTLDTTYYFYVVFKRGIEITKVKYSYFYSSPVGDIVYKTPGTYTYIVPAGITSINILGIGAGGGGEYDWSSAGGGGGCLAYVNNVTVTPGQTIAITVPASTAWATNGANAVIGTLLTVQGGQYSQSSYLTPNAGGSLTPTGAGQGGHVSGQYGGGGGAGGYGNSAGTDARGGYTAYGQSFAGANGAAGGGAGYSSSTYGFGGGGGVDVYGRGPSGAAQAYNNGNSFYSDGRYGGLAGSGGENGADNSNSSQQSNKGRTIYHGCGGNYGGGGGGGGTSTSGNGNFCRGAQGAVRICYGGGVAFPTSNVSKQSYTIEV
jgi:hypothetical protein